MGDYISFLSGAFLFIVALLVVKEYWPSSFKLRDMPPPTMLQFGIFLGFVITASNTFWWQILNTIVVDMGWTTRVHFQQIGKFMDLPLKGGMGVVGLIHLRAKQKSRTDYDPRT